MKRIYFLLLCLGTLQATAQTDSQVFTTVEVHPEYPGGHGALVKFINKNMTYPRAALKKKITGTVYVQFIVERDGSISSVSTLRGISKERCSCAIRGADQFQRKAGMEIDQINRYFLQKKSNTNYDSLTKQLLS